MLEIAGGILLAYFALVLIVILWRPLLWLLGAGALICWFVLLFTIAKITFP